MAAVDAKTFRPEGEQHSVGAGQRLSDFVLEWTTHYRKARSGRSATEGKRNDREHPTQKPVALFLPPIQNHTIDGAVLYEPFAGSGSQVIAAEQTGRRCFGLEIDPAYCQVIIDRWGAFTGQRANKVGEAIRAT